MKRHIAKDIRDGHRAWEELPSEHRKWFRYPPLEGVEALLEGRPYKVLDISRGGISIYNRGEEAVPEESTVSLHHTEEGHFLCTVRCRKVEDSRIVFHSTFNAEIIRRISLEFVEEDPHLFVKLEPFMKPV